MPVSSINVRVDDEVKKEAQDIFLSLGMDMSTAINVFLRQAIRLRSIPFHISSELPRNSPQPGGWEGKIWMADDFNAPIEDFKEYME